MRLPVYDIEAELLTTHAGPGAWVLSAPTGSEPNYMNRGDRIKGIGELSQSISPGQYGLTHELLIHAWPQFKHPLAFRVNHLFVYHQLPQPEIFL